MATSTAPAAPAALPKGSPLDADPSLLSVLSYNLLAPIYVRPIDTRTGGVQAFAAFEWAEPAGEVLAFDARWPRMLAEIEAAAADVVCLQEVQFEERGGEFVLPGWLRPMAAEAGGSYVARIPAQPELTEMAELAPGESVIKCRYHSKRAQGYIRTRTAVS
jgi:hypothetical protein